MYMYKYMYMSAYMSAVPWIYTYACTHTYIKMYL
jgi:hypothetical protein